MRLRVGLGVVKEKLKSPKINRLLRGSGQLSAVSLEVRLLKKVRRAVGE